jgi:hypothetical protein
MDLSNPMIDENDKKYINQFVKSKELNYMPRSIYCNVQ